jgi:IS5 family transposase
MHFSADPDARWVKKGSKSTLGYKAFARADEDGYIDRVHTTPANQAESPHFATMIEGSKGATGAGRQGLCQPRQPRGAAWQAPRRHHAQGRAEAARCASPRSASTG